MITSSRGRRCDSGHTEPNAWRKAGILRGGHARADDDIRTGTVDDLFQFSLLLGGDGELVQRLLKIVQKRLPLLAGYLQMSMRVRHGFACVFLRATGGPAD